MLLDHLERDDATSKLIRISLGHAQMEVGSGTDLFQLWNKNHTHLIPDTWIKQLWKFTSTCKATITIPSLWIPSLQRLYDRYLMDIGREAGFSRADQVHLRQAAIVLNVHTLGDIVTVDGIRIKEGIFEGILEYRKSNYQWPHPQPWRKAYG